MNYLLFYHHFLQSQNLLHCEDHPKTYFRLAHAHLRLRLHQPSSFITVWIRAYSPIRLLIRDSIQLYC